MNSVNVSGRLGKDPEVRSTQGGSTIMSFSLAVSDRRKNGQTGKWEEITHWLDCVVFGKRAESLAKILRKGSYVMVTGRLSQSKWEDKQGNKRSKVEVVVSDVDLPPRTQDQSQGGYQQHPNNYTNQGQYGPQNGSQGFSGGYQHGYQQPTMDVYSSDMPFSYPTLG